MSGAASVRHDDANVSHLILENGSIFLGKHFGADVSVDGEIGEFMSEREHVLVLQVGAVCMHVHPVSRLNFFKPRIVACDGIIKAHYLICTIDTGRY